VDKILAGTIARGILWVLAALAVRYGIEVKDTAWVEGLSLALAGVVVAVAALVWSRIKDRKLLMAEPPAETPKLTGSLTKPPGALLLLLALALGLGGCTAQATYRMEAVVATVDSLGQVEKGATESLANLHLYIAAQEDTLWKAYQVDLGNIQARIVPGPLTPEQKEAGYLTIGDVPAELARLAVLYQTKQAKIAQSRRTVDAGAALVAEHVRFARATLADVYALEHENLGIQQRLDRYRQMAAEYARQKFGLTVPAETVPAATAP